MLSIRDVNLSERRVLIREDLNVPLRDGAITDEARIAAALPTLKYALDQGAATIVVTHLGRPKEGEFDQAYSVAPVAARLGELLGTEVRVIPDWRAGIDVAPGQLVMLENIRFAVGEKANDNDLARELAGLCDVFINDAFATAHRAQASTHGIAKYAPVVCAGPLLLAEIEALQQALEKPARPLVAIVGGAKVSTKLEVLETLSERVDQLIVGGGIANTFLAAAGFKVGKSLQEAEMVFTAKRLLQKASIPLPTDVVVAPEFSADAPATVKRVEDVGPDDMILDVGPDTTATLVGMLEEAGTIVWNGPLGVFEFEAFSAGTRALADAIARSSAFTIAGGGDTVAAINQFDVADQVSYISTGGGAFLEFLEGKTLPAVEILEERERTLPAQRHPSEPD